MTFCDKYASTVASAILILYILLLQPKKLVPPSTEVATVPVPEPECFPIKPTRRPLPTFSGPVVTVTANGASSPGQFDYEILNAAPDTTIQLDGS
jgi:hypothetical protein